MQLTVDLGQSGARYKIEEEIISLDIAKNSTESVIATLERIFTEIPNNIYIGYPACALDPKHIEYKPICTLEGMDYSGMPIIRWLSHSDKIHSNEDNEKVKEWIKYQKISNRNELKSAFGVLNDSNNRSAELIEVMCKVDQEILPAQSFKVLPDGKRVQAPLHDMAPFLSQEELDREWPIK